MLAVAVPITGSAHHGGGFCAHLPAGRAGESSEGEVQAAGAVTGAGSKAMGGKVDSAGVRESVLQRAEGESLITSTARRSPLSAVRARMFL